MKPLFTFLIPCYNGEQFIDNSFHSLMNERLLTEDILKYFEIIFVDDGSKDNSVKKAKTWEKEWNEKVGDNFIKIISKPNGQYGSVINIGIKEAKGTYLKVLDVDDTFNVSSLIKLTYMTLGLKHNVDVIYTDHTYEKVGSNVRSLISLRECFPPNKIIDVKETKFPKDLITMHSVIYRTKLLKEIKYQQIEGVYYSDSQYSLIPLMYVNSVFYAELPLYRYYIGRGEQSINMKVMIKNMAHQAAVRDIIISQVDLSKMKNQELERYFTQTMKQMIQWSILLIASNKEIKHKPTAMTELLKHIKKLQPKYSKNILRGILIKIIKITRGHFLAHLIRMAVKIYSKFKKNILAEWD